MASRLLGGDFVGGEMTVNHRYCLSILRISFTGFKVRTTPCTTYGRNKEH